MKKYIILTFAGLLILPMFVQAEEIRNITFPIEVGYDYNFSDTFGAARSGGRSHEGTDIMVDQMTPLLAAVDGRISYLVDKDQGWGLALYLEGDDGYSYRYLHINNDTPGTDDGKEIRAYAFPKNIVRGSQVKAGQIVAFAGDSGNAEYTGHHLHFEIWTPGSGSRYDYDSGREAINSYPSLMAAIDENYKLEEDIIESAPSLSNYQFTRNLTLGDRGEDVLELQKYLNLAGFTVAVSGPGSRDNETTYFGPATQSALIKFQKAQGISPALGYFGPITIAEISNNLEDPVDNEVNQDNVNFIEAGWLVKTEDDPKVYYVDDNLNLRWLTSESAASSRFGSNWGSKLKIINNLIGYEVGRNLN